MNYNFYKDKLGLSKESLVFIYVLEHASSETSTYSGTLAQIQSDLKVSQPCVTKTMRKLEDMGVVEYQRGRGWKVNIPMKDVDYCNGKHVFLRNLGP